MVGRLPNPRCLARAVTLTMGGLFRVVSYMSYLGRAVRSIPFHRVAWNYGMELRVVGNVVHGSPRFHVEQTSFRGVSYLHVVFIYLGRA